MNVVMCVPLSNTLLCVSRCIHKISAIGKICQMISQGTLKMVVCLELAICLVFRLCIHVLMTKRRESILQPEEPFLYTKELGNVSTLITYPLVIDTLQSGCLMDASEHIPFIAIVLSGLALSKSEHNTLGCLWSQDSYHKPTWSIFPL